MNSSGDTFAWHVVADYAGDIKQLWLPIRTVASSPANGLKISIQGRTTEVNDVIPNGTDTHYRVILTSDLVSDTMVQTGRITDDGTTGGTLKTAAVGETITFVADYQDYDTGDDVDIAYVGTMNLAAGDMTAQHWTSYQNDGGNWVNAMTIYGPMVIEYDDGQMRPVPAGATQVGATDSNQYFTITSSADPDEAGALFAAPWDGRIGGLQTYMVHGASSAFITYIMYDANDVELYSTTVGALDRAFLGSNPWAITFTSGIEVKAGENYRLTMINNAAASIYMYYSTITTSLTTAVGGGSNFQLTQRTDGGSWTNTSNRKPGLGLLYSQIYTGLTGPKIDKSGPRYSSKSRRFI
jgi:hypothetical protein